MNKVTILIFALAITHALGACDTNVATHFGLGTLNGDGSTTLANTLPTCASLEGDTASCCTDADVDTFEARTTTRTTELSGLAETRDNAYLDARAAVAAAYKDDYAAFVTAATNAASVLVEWEDTQPSAGTSAQDITDIQDAITSISALFVAFRAAYNDLYAGFETYRTARKTCFDALLTAEAAGYCLACLDDGSAGWTANSITVSGTDVTIPHDDTLKDTLAGACYAYLVASESQSAVLQLNYYAAGLPAMTAALVKIAAETEAGVAEFLTAAQPDTSGLQASEVPADCTSATDCDFVGETMFVNGLVVNGAAVLGGDAVTSRRRILQGARVLQFNPDADEVGYEIDFPEKPGDIEQEADDLSALRVGVFSCIVAFFVALLI